MPAPMFSCGRADDDGGYVILTCHFKHAGLWDGAPLNTPSGVVKTYSRCALRCCGARCGSWLVP